MTLRPLLVALPALLLAGCDEGAVGSDLPDSLLVEALVETHLAAARAERTGADADSLRAAALDRLGLDTAAVARALDAYADRPDEYAELYGRALDRLLRGEAEDGGDVAD